MVEVSAIRITFADGHRAYVTTEQILLWMDNDHHHNGVPDRAKTHIHLLNGDHWHVLETPEQIANMINNPHDPFPEVQLA